MKIPQATAAALIALVLTSCSGSSAKSGLHHQARVAINGTVDLTDSSGWQPTSYGRVHVGQLCAGSGGYDDIAPGAQVIVSDDAGHTLQISKLDQGYVTNGFDCRFTFSAYVLAGKRFYGVEVTHRGVVKEPESKLGHVALSLG